MRGIEKYPGVQALNPFINKSMVIERISIGSRHTDSVLCC